jgi:hypothetical protein
MDGKKGSYLCLGIECESEDEQEMWLGMNVQEVEVFEIRSST